MPYKEEEYGFILGAFREYVSNDAECAEPEYIREMLETVGIDRNNAAKYGFEEYFSDVN